jgi:hypothetical protein
MAKLEVISLGRDTVPLPFLVPFPGFVRLRKRLVPHPLLTG